MLARKLFFILLFCGVLGLSNIAFGQSHWPDGSHEAKPWTRWWWMGNAVDKEGIRNSLVDLSKAGIGGVEIGIRSLERAKLFQQPDRFQLERSGLKLRIAVRSHRHLHE